MSTFFWVAFALVTITSAARLTRLATVDKFPPAVWVREKWASLTVDTGWIWLFYCGYCFSFWAAALVIGSAYGMGVLHPVAGPATAEVWTHVWWLINGTLGAAYLAAILMSYDGDMNSDEDDD